MVFSRAFDSVFSRALLWNMLDEEAFVKIVEEQTSKHTMHRWYRLNGKVRKTKVVGSTSTRNATYLRMDEARAEFTANILADCLEYIGGQASSSCSSIEVQNV